jgi:hypothetical protein
MQKSRNPMTPKLITEAKEPPPGVIWLRQSAFGAAPQCRILLTREPSALLRDGSLAVLPVTLKHNLKRCRLERADNP